MPSRTSRPRAPIQVPAGVVMARVTREDRTMADKTMADKTFRWFAGIDWGSAKHQVCLLDGTGKVVGERAFAHGGAGLAALCEWIVSMAGDPGSIAVAIEVPHGPVVDALLDRGFAVYAINPKQLERLRDRVSLAGAKDDRRDARVAAGGLRTDPHLFRAIEAGDPAVIALREWWRLAEELQHERVRLGHRIRQQLWRYYPQLLEVSDNVTAEWVLDLWALAPTPAKAERLREATLARLLQEHRIRRLDAERALGILRQPAIAVAEGVTEAAVLHLRSLVARLRRANREFHQAERKLDELCTNLRDNTSTPKIGGPRDAAVLSSLPGIGPVTLAILLTEAAGPIKRRDYAALRTLSGVAPVTKRSGKSCLVKMRYAAQIRLRNALFHWARVAVLNDPTCGSRYAALRARGHSYGRALRGVADRLLGVACVLLQRQALFDPAHDKRAASQPRAAAKGDQTRPPSSDQKLRPRRRALELDLR